MSADPIQAAKERLTRDLTVYSNFATEAGGTPSRSMVGHADLRLVLDELSRLEGENERLQISCREQFETAKVNIDACSELRASHDRMRAAVDGYRQVADQAKAFEAEARRQIQERDEALKPFAWIGQWLFARDLPDDTPMVTVQGIGRSFDLTRGMFKLAARPGCTTPAEAEEKEDYSQEWHNAVEAICTILGVGGGLGASEGVEAVRAHDANLTRERNKARDLLAPFAEFADLIEQETNGFDYEDKVALALVIPDGGGLVEMDRIDLGCFYAARALLSPGKGKGEDRACIAEIAKSEACMGDDGVICEGDCACKRKAALSTHEQREG